jgi:hypothetical protein
MKRLGSPAALTAGFGVLLVANAAIFGAAGWNRRGGPRAEMELTERELALPLYHEKDDTGVLLSLVTGDRPPAIVSAFRALKGRRQPRFEHRWLDRAKLRSLGFDVDRLDPAAPDAKERCTRALPRRAFVALEFDGAEWRGWIEDQERRVESPPHDAGGNAAPDAKLLDVERMMRSRLMPVDASPDAETLERRYPDHHRYAVLAAVIGLEVVESKGKPPTLGGRIQELMVDEVQVPSALRPQIEKLLPRVSESEFWDKARELSASGWPAPVPPRYRAVIAFGRRHEPWLVSVAPLESAPER